MTDWLALVREHTPMAFRTAWRILGHLQDTEDVVQEALLEVFRAHCHGKVHNWGAFVRVTATCRALDRLRRRRRSESLPDVPSPGHESPERVAEAKELAQWLRSAVAALPPRQAEVFSLCYFGELSNAEIASALNITNDAVAVALHKARASIASKHTQFADSSRSVGQ